MLAFFTLVNSLYNEMLQYDAQMYTQYLPTSAINSEPRMKKQDWTMNILMKNIKW